ncbi:MAG: Crp/Fnr family transcriptional regulator [Chloroflexi bacterium]|nr:Crp/Fnr family transcriptional regulator [Chloroflexota bacterium]
MNTRTLHSLLEQNPVFGRLTAAEHEELIRTARERTLDKGEVLCHQGERWPRVALLAAGGAQWTLVAPSGRRQVVFRLSPGAAVWGHTMFDDQPMPASLEITAAAFLYWWPREIVLPLLWKHPDALWALNGEIVGWMRQVREVIYSLAFQSVAHRVARLLVKYYPPHEGRPLPRYLTLDEMAAMVGTSRELVSRVLQRLAREGVLQVRRRHFIFTDRRRLEQLAQGG